MKRNLAETLVSSLHPALALRALDPSTVFQMSYDEGAVLGLLADLLHSVPCFALDVDDRAAGPLASVERVLQLVASEEPARDA